MRALETTNLSLLLCLLIAAAIAFNAPEAHAQGRTAKKANTQVDSLKMKERWSFKTNAIDWLLTIPNASVEYDISSSPYNKNTISIGARYNWETNHKYVPNIVFNVLEGRIEYRNYWRTSQRQVLASDTAKLSFWGRIQRTLSRRRLHPRSWRAYYLGGYVSAGTYSIKLGQEGKQGQQVGAGVSFGYSLPLYAYRNHYVDFEIGARAGVMATKYDVYHRNIENNSYVIDESKAKEWHVLPYPVVNELNFSFIYRFGSIKNKYKLINYEKIERKLEEKRARENYRDSVATAKAAKERINRRDNEWLRDSTIRAKEIQKESGVVKAPEEKVSKKKQKKGKETPAEEEIKTEALPATENGESTKEESKPVENNKEKTEE